MMIKKTLYIAVLAVLISVATVAQKSKAKEINWLTIEEAMELSEKKPKKILVDFYTDWCGFCKKMDKTTYEDPEVIKKINKEFYPVKFDAEQKEALIFRGKTLVYRKGQRRGAHEFAIGVLQGRLSYPSTSFLDNEGRLITTVPGWVKPDEMLSVLEYIGDDIYMKKTFEDHMGE